MRCTTAFPDALLIYGDSVAALRGGSASDASAELVHAPTRPSHAPQLFPHIISKWLLVIILGIFISLRV